jgi:hypothetical protein
MRVTGFGESVLGRLVCLNVVGSSECGSCHCIARSKSGLGDGDRDGLAIIVAVFVDLAH